MSGFLAELVGTFILVLMGDGVVANVLLKRSKGEGSGWIVITTGWGLAVTFGVYAVGWMSGGHLNPAVTLGLAAAGMFPWEDRKSTRLNSSHVKISYAVFCLKQKRNRPEI